MASIAMAGVRGREEIRHGARLGPRFDLAGEPRDATAGQHSGPWEQVFANELLYARFRERDGGSDCRKIKVERFHTGRCGHAAILWVRGR
jgi:hypothetical protein